MHLKFFVFLAGAVLAARAATPEAVSLKTMDTALKFRAAMVAAISTNQESADNALKRLQANTAASGLSLGTDADLGHAALDVGRRLLAKRPDAAALFFRAAEAAFQRAANLTPSTQPADKAQYLQKLSLIRAQYLNKPDQARLDIEAAIQLLPADKTLQRIRNEVVPLQSQDFVVAKKTGQAAGN